MDETEIWRRVQFIGLNLFLDGREIWNKRQTIKVTTGEARSHGLGSLSSATEQRCGSALKIVREGHGPTALRLIWQHARKDGIRNEAMRLLEQSRTTKQ